MLAHKTASGALWPLHTHPSLHGPSKQFWSISVSATYFSPLLVRKWGAGETPSLAIRNTGPFTKEHWRTRSTPVGSQRPRINTSALGPYGGAVGLMREAPTLLAVDLVLTESLNARYASGCSSTRILLPHQCRAGGNTKGSHPTPPGLPGLSQWEPWASPALSKAAEC